MARYYVGGQYEVDVKEDETTERFYIEGDAYSSPAVAVKNPRSGWQIHYLCRDYLGSITHITNASGVVVQELSYDPWGRLRDPETQIIYKSGKEPDLLLYRGYTGHEHLSMFGLINMNARLYDPVVGRFLSPDPHIQAPWMSQNFNRYSYALNNPLKYRDENGEWFIVDDIIAAVVGGTVNLIGNAIAGNVNSWGQAFSYFGVGAAGAWASIYTGPIVGGMIIAGGNSVVTQGFDNGFNNISWEQVGLNTLMGGVTSYASVGVSSLIQKPLNAALGNITNPLLQTTLKGSTSGAITGFTVNTGIAKINGASWEEALLNGRDGAIFGAATNASANTINWLRYSYRNNLNPISGKRISNEFSSATPNVYKHDLKYDPRVRARGLEDPSSHDFPY